MDEKYTKPGNNKKDFSCLFCESSFGSTAARTAHVTREGCEENAPKRVFSSLPPTPAQSDHNLEPPITRLPRLIIPPANDPAWKKAEEVIQRKLPAIEASSLNADDLASVLNTVIYDSCALFFKVAKEKKDTRKPGPDREERKLRKAMREAQSAWRRAKAQGAPEAESLWKIYNKARKTLRKVRKLLASERDRKELVKNTKSFKANPWSFASGLLGQNTP